MRSSLAVRRKRWWCLIEMTNTDEQEQKRPLTLARAGGRLELRKNVETGQVRQSFSHGRSKTVTVEVRKKRTIGPTTEPGRAEAAPAVARDQTPLRPATGEPARRPVAVPRALTAEEKALLNSMGPSKRAKEFRRFAKNLR